MCACVYPIKSTFFSGVSDHCIILHHFMSKTYVIWWFPKMGVPPNHQCYLRVFHEINHPAIGDPP